MPIETEHLFIYHIPKTGGCWVRYALVELKVRHQRVGAQHGWDNPPAGKTGVCFVRNPLTWYVSVWATAQSASRSQLAVQPIHDIEQELKNNWTRLAYLNKLAARYDFKDFLTRVTAEAPGMYGAFCEPYVSRSRRVGTTENIREDVFLIAVHEDVDAKKAHKFTSESELVNVSPDEAKSRCVYDDDMKETVMVAERKMFERWGYDDKRPI